MLTNRHVDRVDEGLDLVIVAVYPSRRHRSTAVRAFVDPGVVTFKVGFP